ncbi:hypothetical protein O1611_g7217 [Lasiodiplodia mahajangana]|uniref:Uncharacterized protein n=1 Tax=Lasiodiplodia mahajangana TaxID=1108764 RepID=A0ACC2JG27_9PEZI|nr:hypothetical protein O1611_g7217 [Lasiodiplodia mahajangana]
MAAQQPKPFGEIVSQTSPAIHPSQETTLSGRYVTLVGLATKHIEPLYANLAGDENAHLWDYMADGPFPDSSGLHAMMEGAIASPDVITYALIPADQPTTPDGADNVVGVASYMRADLTNRTIEVGVLYTPRAQRTTAATEAMYLMARHAFDDLGYRRYEWKCDALECREPQDRAAARDTAWYSIVDDDWPDVESVMRRWLDPSNFDESGRQLKKLEDFREKLLELMESAESIELDDELPFKDIDSLRPSWLSKHFLDEDELKKFRERQSIFTPITFIYQKTPSYLSLAPIASYRLRRKPSLNQILPIDVFHLRCPTILSNILKAGEDAYPSNCHPIAANSSV